MPAQAGLPHCRSLQESGHADRPAGVAWRRSAAGQIWQVIILDTNVLSALMRTAPDTTVVAWLDTQPAESVWITSITLFEAHLGLALLPRGRRAKRWKPPSPNCCKKIWKDAYSNSTVLPQSNRPCWRQSGRKPGGQWTCAIHSLPALRSRDAPPSPPETSATLQI